MRTNSNSPDRTRIKGALTATALVAALGGGMLTAPAAQASAPAWTNSATPAVVLVARSYTKATVAKHHTASNCWSIVDGKVYNLTKWIAKHPGGRKRIVRMCGKDASAAFHSQHSSGSRASTVYLKRYKIGTVR